MRQLSDMISQHPRDLAQVLFLLLRVGGCSRPGPQRCQPLAQPCRMVRGHGGSARPPQPRSLGVIASHRCLPITPKPMPAPTLSLLLQLLGSGPDFGHVALVGLQQLPWPLLVPLWWGRPLAGLSLLHRGLQQAGGARPHQPRGLGRREPVPTPGVWGSPYLRRQPPGSGVSHAEQGPLTGGEHIPQGSPPRSPQPPPSPHGRQEPRKQEETAWLSAVPMLGHPDLAEANRKERVKKRSII